MTAEIYLRAGNGIPVIFLHGIGGAARLWQAQLESFSAAGFSAVALDLPGYGSRPPVGDISFDAYAEDLEALVARLGLDRPVLVGHSLGGMIAQTALRRRPDGYRAVALSGTSPAFGNAGGDFQKQFLADRLGPLDAGRSMADLAPSIVASIMGPQPDPAGRAQAISAMGSTSEATYRAAMHCIVRFDERANLPAIHVPVLCLAGEHDRNAPAAMMERMAGKIPGARYVCLPGIGHLPNLEAPQAFDHAVLGFLSTACPPTPTT
ncbi:alpha/beta fold hydrolase [Ferrovibrio terrae]|uniref:alpha/beta fold hydrolase n=1 Tax=Ferrovibrio terrae TaxID=2594003 RepID=UPI003137C7C3